MTVRGSIRAFADDIGAVIEDWDGDGPKLEAIFREFATISGLELNIPKTVAIPLWDEPLPDIKQALGIAIPAWRDIAVQSKGTYLGLRCGTEQSRKLVGQSPDQIRLAVSGLGLHGYRISSRPQPTTLCVPLPLASLAS